MNSWNFGRKKLAIPTFSLIIVSSFTSVFVAYITGTFIDLVMNKDVQALKNNILVGLVGLLFFFY